MSPMPHRNDVLYLVAQYLQAKGLYASSLALQQESGLDVTWLRGSLREIALLRRWVFAGDVTRARAFLQPLESLSTGGASDEMQAALLALDELEVLVRTQTQGEDKYQERSRLAEVKLKCFKRLVPLFRAPVDMDESDVFKYVAAPKLQLAGLIRDAVVFHRQSDDTTQDCISVMCSEVEEEATEEENNILVLDAAIAAVSVESCELVPASSNTMARSMEWTRWRKRPRNPMALSTNLSKRQWPENSEDGDDVRSKVDEEKQCLMKETADVTVSCKIDIKDIVDAAVICGLDVKETIDAAVSCRLEARETTDAAVSCGTNDWSDVATQTENLQLFDHETETLTLQDNDCGKGANESFRGELESNGSNVNVDRLLEARRELDQRLILDDSTSSSKRLIIGWGQKSSGSLAMDSLDTAETNLEVNQSQLKVMAIRNSPLSEEDGLEEPQQDIVEETNCDPGMALLEVKGPPQHYDELKLDHVVCASVIAEVNEPQAGRALDVHPNGMQVAVGTNARALRVFDLSTSLRRRQEQLSWSSPLNLILPLLPVALERHKHHDSGIYCVSYNQHLRRHATGSTTSMIASGAADGSVKVLVVREKDPLQRQQNDELWIQRGDINGSMGKARALAFASPHLLWTTTTNDLRLRCWDVRQAHRSSSSGPLQALDGHVEEIQAIAMPHSWTSGSTSTLLLSAALDKTVRLWDTRSRRCERLVTSGAHAAFSLHFHPTDEKLVVSGHQDGSVSVWDLRSTAREALQIVVPHEDECRSVRWSPGGQWLLSAAFDGTLCVMQAMSSTLQPVASYHKHYGKVLQAQWHPTEPAFVSSGADKRVKLWAFA